jgi:hypothetical protein
LHCSSTGGARRNDPAVHDARKERLADPTLTRLPAAESDTSVDLGCSVRKLYWGSSEIGFSHSSNVNTVDDTDGTLP